MDFSCIEVIFLIMKLFFAAECFGFYVIFLKKQVVENWTVDKFLLSLYKIMPSESFS